MQKLEFCIYTHPFNGLLYRTTRVSRYQKGKNQSGFYWSKIQWVAVASAGLRVSLHLVPCRQITTPAPHHSVFLQAECPSCRPTNIIRALKALKHLNLFLNNVRHSYKKSLLTKINCYVEFIYRCTDGHFKFCFRLGPVIVKSNSWWSLYTVVMCWHLCLLLVFRQALTLSFQA